MLGHYSLLSIPSEGKYERSYLESHLLCLFEFLLGEKEILAEINSWFYKYPGSNK